MKRASRYSRPSRPLVKPEKVPPGWYTRQDLQEAWALSSSRTRELVSAALRNGMAEHRIFRLKTITRGVYPIHHYRFKS